MLTLLWIAVALGSACYLWPHQFVRKPAGPNLDTQALVQQLHSPFPKYLRRHGYWQLQFRVDSQHAFSIEWRASISLWRRLFNPYQTLPMPLQDFSLNAAADDWQALLQQQPKLLPLLTSLLKLRDRTAMQQPLLHGISVQNGVLSLYFLQKYAKTDTAAAEQLAEHLVLALNECPPPRQIYTTAIDALPWFVGVSIAALLANLCWFGLSIDGLKSNGWTALHNLWFGGGLLLWSLCCWVGVHWWFRRQIWRSRSILKPWLLGSVLAVMLLHLAMQEVDYYFASPAQREEWTVITRYTDYERLANQRLLVRQQTIALRQPGGFGLADVKVQRFDFAVPPAGSVVIVRYRVGALSKQQLICQVGPHQDVTVQLFWGFCD